MIKTIGVFCSAAENIDKTYFEAASTLGRWMGENGIRLVYGGAEMGLMEAMARAVREADGHITGVVPKCLCERGKVSHLPDEIIPCNNLAERKQIMLQHSDLLLALPGGIGTLDEVFHIMGSATIGEHAKRVVLYNVNGFWDDCLHMLQRLYAKGFIRASLDNYIIEVKSTIELGNVCAKL